MKTKDLISLLLNKPKDYYTRQYVAGVFDAVLAQEFSTDFEIVVETSLSRRAHIAVRDWANRLKQAGVQTDIELMPGSTEDESILYCNITIEC